MAHLIRNAKAALVPVLQLPNAIVSLSANQSGATSEFIMECTVTFPCLPHSCKQDTTPTIAFRNGLSDDGDKFWDSDMPTGKKNPWATTTTTKMRRNPSIDNKPSQPSMWVPFYYLRLLVRSLASELENVWTHGDISIAVHIIGNSLAINSCCFTWMDGAALISCSVPFTQSREQRATKTRPAHDDDIKMSQISEVYGFTATS